MKCENLQKVGAFKFRGACNAVFSLSAEEAQPRRLHPFLRQPCPGPGPRRAHPRHPRLHRHARTAPAVKKAAVAGYGGQITYCQPTLQARESTLAEIAARTGAVEIHPYNNERVIAGPAPPRSNCSATYPDLDIVMAPVGGGGLISRHRPGRQRAQTGGARLRRRT